MGTPFSCKGGGTAPCESVPPQKWLTACWLWAEGSECRKDNGFHSSAVKYPTGAVGCDLAMGMGFMSAPALRLQHSRYASA